MPRIAHQSKLEEYDDIFKQCAIPTAWHSEFVGFVETGQGSSEFTDYLDSSDNAQQALELAFLRRVEHVKQVLDVLQNADGR